MHLVIDGYECNQKKLRDLELVYRTLDEYPARIGMTKIIPPYVFRYYGIKPEDWGVSGFVLIAESHIGIHTFPEKKYVNIDVFSCKAFDTQLALEFVKRKLEIKEVKGSLIERGLEYPKDLGSAFNVINLEREQVTSLAS